MTTLKVRKVGNSLGAVFPKDVVARLRVAEGDLLYVVEAPDGVVLTPFDPAFERQMRAARKIMKQDRKVLRELAK